MKNASCRLMQGRKVSLEVVKSKKRIICTSLYTVVNVIKIARMGRKVIKMDNTTWESLVIEVQEYLEADETLEAGLVQVIELNLQIGQNNESEREAVHTSLKALLKGRDGSPLGRRGQKSSVPASVRVSIDRICGVVQEAATGYFNHDAIIGAITLRHNKSGGGNYESAEDYASAVVKRTRSTLSSLYKDGNWDGSVESLLPSEE